MIFTASTFSWEQRKVGDLLIERNQQAPMSDEYPLMAFIANEGVAPKGERYDRSALVTDTVNKLYIISAAFVLFLNINVAGSAAGR